MRHPRRRSSKTLPIGCSPGLLGLSSPGVSSDSSSTSQELRAGLVHSSSRPRSVTGRLARSSQLARWSISLEKGGKVRAHNLGL